MVRKVHYCWFGSSLPPQVAENIADWQRLNPEFEFCEWNDKNSDITDYPYAQQALAERRWSFLSDVVRLQKLYEQGGFYLDTDVELIKPFRLLEHESDCLIMGYIQNCALGTAVIYSPPAHPVIGDVLEEYKHIRSGCWPVNNRVFTHYFINNLPDFLLNGQRWKSDKHKISIYPKEYFEKPAWQREQGFSIHHCSGSWTKSNSQPTNFTTRKLTASYRITWLTRQLRSFRRIFSSEYRDVYFNALLLRRRKTLRPDWLDEARRVAFRSPKSASPVSLQAGK
ncbi:Glycosyltransferase sugar-binding region containing DXD motif-containing protein [Catalinimonas alkaloidigena]|uniref:Glycosyltransferase sugar-binding region containing DXD motif-containing protein n=1 Tax=Catalinimonas alkaloidigena TaxID=1075417 RepID=A0A1G9S6M8_9BACT|nr:glycosyltransferase [Catalinimonas alkaloidigena]SDM30950.1 Glycosyltransferase sugar-binding region containing DXD motif-containing protein [Catalinimonas alkaloidigena]